MPALKCKSCQDKQTACSLTGQCMVHQLRFGAHLGMYMPVTCESCQEQHGLYALLPCCAWCASHCIRAHLGMFMPVTCESCQDKHVLHVLLPYCACASYCIRAELDTHMPVMCENYQDKHGLPVLLPDCAWFASYCNLYNYKGGTSHARTCYVRQLPAQTWTACSLTRLHDVPAIV